MATRFSMTTPIKLDQYEFNALMLIGGEKGSNLGLQISQVCSVLNISKEEVVSFIKSKKGEDYQIDMWWDEYTLIGEDVILLYEFELLLINLFCNQNEIAYELYSAKSPSTFQEQFFDVFYYDYFEQKEGVGWGRPIPKRNQLEQDLIDMEYLAIFGRTEAELQQAWQKHDVQNAMTCEELELVADVEGLAARLIKEDELHPIVAFKQAIKQVVKISVITR